MYVSKFVCPYRFAVQLVCLDERHVWRSSHRQWGQWSDCQLSSHRTFHVCTSHGERSVMRITELIVTTWTLILDYTVRCHYNAVNFFQNSHNRHIGPHCNDIWLYSSYNRLSCLNILCWKHVTQWSGQLNPMHVKSLQWNIYILDVSLWCWYNSGC